MNAETLPVTGVGVVNARGESVLMVNKFDGDRPTGVRADLNRVAVMRGDTVLNVNTYGELTMDSLVRRRKIMVVEIDGSTFVRATEVGLIV